MHICGAELLPPPYSLRGGEPARDEDPLARLDLPGARELPALVERESKSNSSKSEAFSLDTLAGSFGSIAAAFLLELANISQSTQS
jgi:hypothetical protein